MSLPNAVQFAVVIPAFNEVATIADVVKNACQYIDKVIVVDDASTDGTVGALSGLGVAGLEVEIQQHAQNQGKAAALWTGIQRALEHGVGAIITLDGDGQHNPADIGSLLAAHRNPPDDIIIAARHPDRRSAPLIRRIANRIADFWVGWAAGVRVYDSQSGFRLYPAALFDRSSVPVGCGRNFVFESEILIDAVWLGIGCVAVPIYSVYPESGRASHYKPFQDTRAIVKMVANRLYQKKGHLSGLRRSLLEKIRWAGSETD